MCVSCTLQGLEQGAAAGSASGALALLGAGLASIGLRGAADRLVRARVDWLTPGRLKLISAAVTIGVLFAIVALQPL